MAADRGYKEETDGPHDWEVVILTTSSVKLRGWDRVWCFNMAGKSLSCSHWEKSVWDSLLLICRAVISCWYSRYAALTGFTRMIYVLRHRHGRYCAAQSTQKEGSFEPELGDAIGRSHVGRPNIRMTSKSCRVCWIIPPQS
jgi:hypothetical protein